MPIPVERYGDDTTHGAGCTHSASLAALLARGESLEDAARGAAEIATEAVRSGYEPRRGLRTRGRAGPCGSPSSVSSGSSGSSSGADSSAGSATTPPCSADGLVVTQDLLLEGRHFRLDWTSWRDLGYKAAAVNLCDLAAMGATPEALLVSLALPPETAAEDVVALYEGLNEPGVPVVGGDTNAAESVDGRGDRARPQRSACRAAPARSPATCSS